jgi:putative MATE family efflux protein
MTQTQAAAPVENPLGTAPITSLLLKYAPPAVLSMMVSALYNIIDTFFVGHGVGENGIAATTVAFPLMILTGGFAAWFGAGGNALAALRLGEGKKDVANRALGNTLLMLVVVPIVLSAVALVFLDPVLNFLGATDANRQMSHDFCSVILMGFVLQAVGAGLSNFIRTDGSPSYALVVMIVGTVVSCVFNWLFVMQLGWGMTGSALATVLGQLTTTVLVLQYFFSKRAQMRITRAGLVPDAKLIGTIAMLGLSTFVVQVASSLTSSILNLQITALGPTDPVGVDGGLAVIGTVNKVIQVLLFVILGFSVAAQPILGFNYGAQNYRRVRKALWTTVGVALVVNFVLWLLCRIFCDQIMTFFGLTSDMHEFASSTLMFMTLAFPIVPLQIIGSNYFQATGQPLKATILTLTRQIIFYLPCLFIIPTVLPGITGMTPLACLPAAVSTADILAIIVTGVFVVREMGRLNRLQAAHDARFDADAEKPVSVGKDVR